MSLLLLLFAYILNYLQANTAKVPTLEVYNSKSKAMTISRGSETIIVNPSSTQELKDGDNLHLAVGISTS